MFVLFSMCIPTFNSLCYDKMLTHIHTVFLCHGDNVFIYNTDIVSHQTSLNRPSCRIPLSSPYIWLHTVSMNPMDDYISMSGLLSLKVLLKRPVGLGSTILTRIYNAENLYKKSRKHALYQEEVVSGATTCKTLTRLKNDTLEVVAMIISRRIT